MKNTHKLIPNKLTSSGQPPRGRHQRLNNPEYSHSIVSSGQQQPSRGPNAGLNLSHHCGVSDMSSSIDDTFVQTVSVTIKFLGRIVLGFVGFFFHSPPCHSG